MTFEISKFLVKQDERLSITVVLTKSPFDSKVGTLIDSLHSSSSKPDRINFVLLPENNILGSEIEPSIIMGKFMEYQKLHVKQAVTKLMQSNGDSPGPVAGVVIDMLCSQIMDVADELGIPKYSFFPSCAGSLGVYLHLLTLYDELNVDVAKFKNDRVTELHMPCFTNPIPARVLPDVILDKAGAELILDHAKRIRETKGVIMNTFMELETQTIQTLSCDLPPLYPVGPILNMILRGAEIKLDYRLKFDYNIHDEDVIVTAKEIEEAIKKVMEAESEMRKRVKDMSEKCKKTLLLGGSSYFSIRRLINDVINNIP
ncbi:hypothetical protein FEM48_Zijuj04G0107000 [Ziziphus jujuba var. spinosa]|uniref:Uncharacterized protein n=1 Tax=Ziziphus jujuba var. spinosa TaxID=714518 RepID=A0A978VJF2_ZIZJJ|nr:hypothetical protein FEM48_Zijuj04G0107000 [Ziziphus jujuba var. spinosa]